ncbi:hypothetical protein [Nonomuraea salmonea]|uniref:Uncharacterized protein n=1 Tax=Nonomuraea salmonea TaxID=46181 RepID=A0ABV5P2S9_9ACTN
MLGKLVATGNPHLDAYLKITRATVAFEGDDETVNYMWDAAERFFKRGRAEASPRMAERVEDEIVAVMEGRGTL